ESGAVEFPPRWKQALSVAGSRDGAEKCSLRGPRGGDAQLADEATGAAFQSASERPAVVQPLRQDYGAAGETGFA
ncbi:MAG: hypothetical protein O2901_14185, partial [Verrucomicrobia bacterium]|nr:hypothetical protein [Verrucomicrobiota bacterium]